MLRAALQAGSHRLRHGYSGRTHTGRPLSVRVTLGLNVEEFLGTLEPGPLRLRIALPEIFPDSPLHPMAPQACCVIY